MDDFFDELSESQALALGISEEVLLGIPKTKNGKHVKVNVLASLPNPPKNFIAVSSYADLMGWNLEALLVEKDSEGPLVVERDEPLPDLYISVHKLPPLFKTHSQNDVAGLLRRYHLHGDEDAFTQAYKMLLPIMERKSTSTYGGGTNMRDDILSAASAALPRIALAVNASPNASNYVITRMVGAIKDELRTISYMSRSESDHAKFLDDVSTRFYEKSNRNPTETELRKLTDGKVPQKILDSYLDGSLHINVLSLDFEADNGERPLSEIVPDAKVLHPGSNILQEEFYELFSDAMSRVNPKYAEVIQRYYFNGESGHSIARSLEVTESRISQILQNTLLSPEFDRVRAYAKGEY